MELTFLFFFFKQKTAYEMRISDWSSDVCSSDLAGLAAFTTAPTSGSEGGLDRAGSTRSVHRASSDHSSTRGRRPSGHPGSTQRGPCPKGSDTARRVDRAAAYNAPDHRGNLVYERQKDDREDRSEEHTSELQSLMRNSYAV